MLHINDLHKPLSPRPKQIFDTDLTTCNKLIRILYCKIKEGHGACPPVQLKLIKGKRKAA